MSEVFEILKLGDKELHNLFKEIDKAAKQTYLANHKVKNFVEDKTYQKEVVLQISQEFEKIKQQILNEFDNHPVTREINDGISASNISGTLDGITNLYSFIGFNEGDNPTKAIRDMLEKSTYKIITNTNGISSNAFVS